MEYARIIVTMSLMGFLVSCQDQPESQTNQRRIPMDEMDPRPVVLIETSMGTIKAELWADKAPLTVANFLNYVDKGFYDGLIFHRVMDGFMIQGGGHYPNLQHKSTGRPIKNEASSEVPNNRGTLAMARTSYINSATSGFYINLVDNVGLNHKSNDQLIQYHLRF